jgi:hypothetical protein
VRAPPPGGRALGALRRGGIEDPMDEDLCILGYEINDVDVQ